MYNFQYSRLKHPTLLVMKKQKKNNTVCFVLCNTHSERFTYILGGFISLSSITAVQVLYGRFQERDGKFPIAAKWRIRLTQITWFLNDNAG